MDMKKPASSLPVLRVSEIETESNRPTWLIRDLWLKGAVAFCGGPPKCRKSWLGLEVACAVASASPCLSVFDVEDPGPVLIFMAEDSLREVQARVKGICSRRKIPFDNLDLNVITATSLKLDQKEDRDRLVETVKRINPRFLLLDPLVRMHGLDENSAREISTLLSFLRNIQREHDVSIMITHHANKKTHGRPGERLRGSSDLYAFADSAIYLFAKQDGYEMTIEHRSAPSIDPMIVDLVTKDGATTLELTQHQQVSLVDLSRRVLASLEAAKEPMTRISLRSSLKVKNQRLGDCLDQLESTGIIEKSPKGWTLMSKHLFDQQPSTHS
jgi:hypothetical protein